MCKYSPWITIKVSSSPLKTNRVNHIIANDMPYMHGVVHLPCHYGMWAFLLPSLLRIIPQKFWKLLFMPQVNRYCDVWSFGFLEKNIWRLCWTFLWLGWGISLLEQSSRFLKDRGQKKSFSSLSSRWLCRHILSGQMERGKNHRLF